MGELGTIWTNEIDRMVVKPTLRYRLWRWIRWRVFRQATFHFTCDFGPEEGVAIYALRWKGGQIEIMDVQPASRKKDEAK